MQDLIVVMAQFDPLIGDIAELAPGQQDSDSLSDDYDTLDAILERYFEQDQSCETIVAAGVVHDEVERVIRLVDCSEYTRRQAPPGVRVTPKGFGRDRHYPLVNGWSPGE